jgi:hypothetical protein
MHDMMSHIIDLKQMMMEQGHSHSQAAGGRASNRGRGLFGRLSGTIQIDGSDSEPSAYSLSKCAKQEIADKFSAPQGKGIERDQSLRVSILVLCKCMVTLND